MFTVEQIKAAHSKVRSGADFPKYIQEIKVLGVTAFETWVKDSHTEYFGMAGYSTSSTSIYEDLNIANSSDKTRFEHYLKIHQQGETDYGTFCKQCAETGIEKWFVELSEMTCTLLRQSWKQNSNRTNTAIKLPAIPGLAFSPMLISNINNDMLRSSLR